MRSNGLPMQRFNRIYFDTSVLRAEGWPRLSTKLRSCLQLARTLGVRIFLPCVVEQELEAGWTRDLDKASEEVKGKINKLEKYLLGHKIEANIPTRDCIVQIYRSATQDAKNEVSLESIPLTKVPLETLVERAIAKQPPFEEQGKGFQDAVIYFSILDHLDDGTSEAAVLVARDKVYTDSAVAKLAQDRGLKIEVFTSVEDLDKTLITWLDKAVRGLYEQDREKAKKALEDRRSEIESFISVNLEVPESLLWLIPRVLGMSRVELVSIEKVFTPNPLQRTEGEQVELYFEAQVNLHITVESYARAYPTVRMLKVGQEPPSPSLSALAKVLAAGPSREDKVVQKVVSAAATAEYAKNDYRDIRLRSVVLKEWLDMPGAIAKALGPLHSGN